MSPYNVNTGKLCNTNGVLILFTIGNLDNILGSTPKDKSLILISIYVKGLEDNIDSDNYNASVMVYSSPSHNTSSTVANNTT